MARSKQKSPKSSKPPSHAPLAPLHALARACGIHTKYADGLGQKRSPPPETILAMLRALGHDIASPAGAPAAVRALKQTQSEQILEPVIIAWGGSAPPVHLNLPRREGGAGTIRWRLQLEDDAAQYRAEQPSPRAGSRPMLRLPHAIPMGIHKLTIESGSAHATATVLSAPSRCYDGECDDERHERKLGIFLPLYALRSRRSWGIGDLTDLDALTEWAGSLGCDLVGTLPLLACYLDEPFDPSPYSPVSRLHFSALFADIAAAPEIKRSPAARRLVDSPAFKRELDRLRKTDLVDYRGIYAAKRRVLAHLAAAAFANDARKRQIEELLQREPTIDDYARFRAAVDRTRTTWQQWRPRQRSGRLTTRDFDEKDHRTHIYIQFLMREQLAHQSRLARNRGGRLYLDLPLGAHGGGYDIWRFRDHFATDLATGAPPDLMFTHGQNWGFPPLHPQASRRLGHAYFAAAIRNHLRFAGALRIDHVAGLHRLFCIPHGMDGQHGAYVDYPAEEFYAILSIESHRAKARIIGENLGNVPREVTQAMHRRGMLGMWVGQFGISADERRPVPPIAAENLACLNTHDVHPFAAHWKGLDIPMRRHFGWLTDEHVIRETERRKAWREAVRKYLRSRRLLKKHKEDVTDVTRALLLELARSDAEILLVNLEDLWGEERPQNIPGISEGYPNWRNKAARTLEQMMRDRGTADTLRRLARR